MAFCIESKNLWKRLSARLFDSKKGERKKGKKEPESITPDQKNEIPPLDRQMDWARVSQTWRFRGLLSFPRSTTFYIGCISSSQNRFTKIIDQFCASTTASRHCGRVSLHDSIHYPGVWVYCYTSRRINGGEAYGHSYTSILGYLGRYTRLAPFDVSADRIPDPSDPDPSTQPHP